MKTSKVIIVQVLVVFVFLLKSTYLKSQVDAAKLVSLWNHETQLDIAPLVEELGFNLIWTHDPAYTNQKWEDTHMYKCLQIPGVKYVLAKIERAAWGWTQEESVRHAKWVSELSLKYPGIFGLYLNDFYDEIEEGYRTAEQWREIIDAAKSVNPNLKLVVPHYPLPYRRCHPEYLGKYSRTDGWSRKASGCRSDTSSQSICNCRFIPQFGYEWWQVVIGRRI
ncbi:MAG TPA: hypothetical protein GXX42_11340 [Petrimonas sp.]|uniref:hypothetical protein n=1 Tax=Petrimonas sp. TaxID=2023866 RepID=UPI00177A5A61|nr:hypothetical protein [Petrimonas sp.]